MLSFISSLRFDPELEKRFREDYFLRSITIIRIALVLGIILYSVFGVLDGVLAPKSAEKIWIIRFAIVDPVLLAVIGLTFTRLFRRFMQPILSVTAVISGLGIVAMIAVSVEPEMSLHYYAGLILVTMWAYTFVRLLFVPAVISCFTVVLGYELTAILIKDYTASREALTVFINNNFFFLSANVIGMFACYLLERYTRKEFRQRLEIAEKQEELSVERNELRNRINIMDSELDMARSIQQKLIPIANPSDRFCSLYLPMEAVGGDLYDFILYDDGSIGIFLIDVSGHGVPAALITTMLKSTVVESRRFGANPAGVLLHMNGLLARQTPDYFVTAFYGIFEPESRKLTFSNAGHHPPAVVMRNKIERLSRARSFPLAIMDNDELSEAGTSYSNCGVILPRNAKLVIYTDGLVEAKPLGDSGPPFGKIMDGLLMKYYPLTCQELVENVYRDLVEFRNGTRFDDDICLISVDVV